MKISSLSRNVFLCVSALFLPIFGSISHAAAVPAGACLYALDASAADAFQIAGATAVYSACGVVSESSSSSAFEMEGSETLYLQNHSQVSVVGAALLSGQTKLWDTISNAQVQAVKVTSPGDPLASITAPTTGTIVSTSPASYDMNHKPTNNTFSPGVYCGGLAVGNTNGATFTMSPGVYVMAGGGLTLNSQAIVSGTGVTVYNTSSSGWGCSSSYNYTPITISGQVTATLSAPTSGSLNGILFFGNRTGCSSPGSCQDQINGGSTVVLNGALYFKSDKLTITGSNASGYMMLVADKIYINGNSNFGTNGDPYDGISVSVSPTTSSLNAGQTQQFAATVNIANTAVTWSISPAGVGSIGSTGLYTAPATVTTPQTVTVTATSQADTSKSGSATVSLYPPVTVSVSPATATLYSGQAQQLTATGTNSSNNAVTWIVSPAGTGTVSASGVYTAPASVASQTTVTVTATSQANPLKSASATITLSPPIAVSVSPSIATLYGGQTQQLIATVTNTGNTAVTWTISPAGTGTVSSAGLYTAPASIASATTVTVTATSQATSPATASATITLSPPIAVSVSPTTATLYGGQTQQLIATVTNTSNSAVTWTISPAGTGTVSSTGLYTAPASIASATTVTVTATSQANTTKSVSATIALYPPIAVSVNPAAATLYGGQTQQLTAAVTNTSNAGVTWTISPAGTGTVSAAGLYTAPVSITTATTVVVTATSQINSSATASATITLEPPIAVSVSPATATLYGGQTQQLTATVTNTTNVAVTWSVSPAGTGTVSSTGLYTAPAGVPSPTTATVKATSQANSSTTASATISLEPPISVSVSPPTATLSGGQTQQLIASVTNTSNTAVTWTISPAETGTISASGLYTAPTSIGSQQTVTITATSVANGSATGSATVTLNPTACTLTGFTSQRMIVIDHTQVPTTDQSNFPFYFNATDPSFAATVNGGRVTNLSGDDILFSLDPNGATKLDFEVQQYDPVHGQISAWVRIPTLSHTSDTVIYLFYGNSSISTPQSNPAGVWDSSYQSVYHLGNLTSSTVVDSTVNANNGTATNVTPTTGQTGGAAGFNGSTSMIQLPAGVAGSSPRTISAWVKSTSQTGCIYCSGLGSSNPYDHAFSLYANAQATGNVYLQTYGSDNYTAAGTLPLNTWDYVALSYSGGPTTNSSMSLYVNGSLVTNYGGSWNTGVTPNTYNGDFSIGLDPANNNLPFSGSIGEVEVSTSARSASWILAEYENQSSPSTFYSLSADNVVALLPSTGGLFASQNLQFTVVPSTTCNSNFTWSVSPTGVGTITSSGLYTAPSSIATQQAVTITATPPGGTAPAVATVVLLPNAAPSVLTLSAAAASPYFTGTTVSYVAKLTDPIGNPEAGLPVIFTDSGANAGTAEAVTNALGVATFTYTGKNSGSDSIQASAAPNGTAVSSNSVLTTWITQVAPTGQDVLTLSPIGPTPTLGLAGLCGAFTDSTGAVIEPVSLGTKQHILIVPNGATQLQLGVDDDIFFDNYGSGFLVNVNGVPITVTPHAMPWVWVAGGLNSNFSYGIEDGSSPIVAATNLIPGQAVVVSYQSGLVSAGDGGYPLADANGDPAFITGANIGNSGGHFPTYYMLDGSYAVNQSIIFTATLQDGSGSHIANTPVDFTVTGANAQQLAATTDSNGDAVVSYFGHVSGSDVIQAQATPIGNASVLSNSATLIWTSLPTAGPVGSIQLTPASVSPALVGGQLVFTVLARDVSGTPLMGIGVVLSISGADNGQLQGVTDATGKAELTYQNVNPGTATVQCIAIISGTAVYSNNVLTTWTSTGPTGTGSGSVINISISANATDTLPNPFQLSAVVTDSRLPAGSSPTLAWSQVTGPGTTSFANPNQSNTTATFTFPGNYVLELTASNGTNSASAQIRVTVNSSPGVTGWLSSPLTGSTVTGMVPITVAPGITLTSGRLIYYLANDPYATNAVVLNANVTGAGQIGTFDTTRLQNGAYYVQLQATNSLGQTEYSVALVTVAGQYKPGRVTTSVTDLVVPATGIAINIGRQYDSLNASTSSDFGYGWSLSTRVDLSVDPSYNVTFTVGGKRRTFYFTPQYEFFFLGYVGGYTAEPGLAGSLEAVYDPTNCPFGYIVPNSSLWLCGTGAPYSPVAYVYTDPSGTQYTMSADGTLHSIKDIGGNTLTVTAAGITSSTGLSVPFLRDSSGRITKITDPQGNKYLYTYDTAGNLATVTYPGISQASTYTYDPNHLYLSGTDFRNNPLPAAGYYGPTDTDINGLPLNGRLQSVSDGLGETIKYAYNLATNTTTITYPPDGSGNADTATLVYDNLGNLLTSTDPLGHTTTNVFDATGNLLSVTDPLGHTNSYTYDAMGNRTTSTYPKTATSTNTTGAILYNAYSEPTASMDELGNVRMYNYDANFRPQSVTDTVNGKTAAIISSLYSSDGLLQAVGAGVDIFTNPSAASSFTYDANGNMTSALDSFGHYKSFTYNALGQLLSVTLPGTASAATPHATAQMSIGALGFLRAADSQSPSAPSAGCSSYAPPGESTSSYTITYTSAMGSPPTTAVDSLGRTTSYIYDNNRNITSVTDPKGNVYTYAYDSLNRLIKIGLPTSPATYYTFTYDFRNNVLDAIDPSGHDRHNVYDAAGRLISVTLGFGSANATTTSYSYYADGKIQSVTDALNHSTNYTYDAADNLLSVQRGKVSVTYAYDDARNRISQTDGNGNTTHFQYDSRKRLQLVTFADQTTESLSYDDTGNVTNVIDRAGHSVSYTYDTNDHLCSLVQNNNPSASNNTSKYSYDAAGNLTAWTDQNGHQTTQAFDQLNRPVMKLLPDGIRGESAAYDLNSNLISLSKLKSGSATSTATNTYDSLDRLLSEVPDPGFNEPTVSFTYTRNGLPATMTDGTGVTTYSYDSLDRLVTKATPEGALTYTYDAVGNVASMNSSNPNGASVGYTYDNLNRLSTVVDSNLPGGSNTTTYAYDPASNLATATYPSGLQAVFTYDHLNRLSQTTTPVSSYTYQRDPNGNLLSGTELNGRTANWTYDGVDQLTNETVASAPSGANGTVSYGLDPVGNRLNQVSSLGPVSSASTTYSADDWAQSESYNDDGDVIVTGGRGYAYDSRSRLVSMNGGAVTVLYDGVGDRVAKSANGVITRYLVDDLSPTGYPQVVEELVNGAVARRYTYGLQRISESQVVNSAWTASFYQYDGRGTVRMLTNSAGAVTDSYEYDAFGNLLAKTGTTPNNYLYRGEQWDPDLSLYYLRARYYNPVTGRFMTQDPYPGEIHAPASLHRYRYASGNPVNHIDPSGRADLAEYAQISLRVVNLGLQAYNLGQSISCLYWAEASSLNVLIRPQTANSVQQLVSFQLGAVQCGAVAVFSAYGVGEALEGFAPFPEPEGEPLPLDEEPVPNCGECFAAGTPVHTDHGNVPIEMIEVGDKVVARNSATGKLESEPVTALTPLHRDKLLEIRIEGEKDSLRPSTSHPFWVQRGDAQPSWVAAGQLRVGDLVESMQGDWRKITAVTPIEQEQTVYNFTVDKDHDYFVGQTGFLVHNAGGCGCNPINYVRPYIQQWVKDAVMDAADFTEDGLMIDPNSGIPFAGPPDLDHKPGFEWRKLKQAAGREGLTQQELNEVVQDPDLYQYENPSSNRSRCYEAP